MRPSAFAGATGELDIDLYGVVQVSNGFDLERVLPGL